MVYILLNAIVVAGVRSDRQCATGRHREGHYQRSEHSAYQAAH